MSLHNYSEDEERFTGGRASDIKQIIYLSVIVRLSPLIQLYCVSFVHFVQISNYFLQWYHEAAQVGWVSLKLLHNLVCVAVIDTDTRITVLW